jgi:hypothetical protein
MPELWKNIYIDCQEPNPDPVSDSDSDSDLSAEETSPDYQVLADIAHEVLLRSGDILLSLHIGSETFGDNDYSPLIDLVINHASRLKSLSLDMPDDNIDELLSLQLVNFEYLESLTLQSEFPDFGCITLPSGLFQSLPRLQALDIYICFTWPPSDLPTASHPWAQLATLCLRNGGSMPPSIAHTILQSCHNLTSLNIHLSRDDLPGLVTGTRLQIHLHNLKVLVVELWRCNGIANFLKPFILPSLTRLELKVAQGSDFPNWDHASVFSIIPNFGQIESLTIELPIPTNYDISVFLKSTPNVAHLALMTGFSQSTISMVSSGELLPKMKTFRVPLTAYPIVDFLTMLDTRAVNGFRTRGILFKEWLSRPGMPQLPGFGQEVTRPIIHHQLNEIELNLISKLKAMGLLELPYGYGQSSSSPRATMEMQPLPRWQLGS